MDLSDEQRDAMARDWINYAIRWAAIRRHWDCQKGLGDGLDWEQIALDGLYCAVSRFRSPKEGYGPSQSYIRRCLSGAASNSLRNRRVRRARLTQIPLDNRESNLTDRRTMPPEWWAILNEES